MRKVFAVVLSLILAVGVCLYPAATASAGSQYDLPSVITGTDQLFGESSQWEMELSYNKTTKTLLCKSTGKDRYDALYNYLYSMSTDTAANRFVDQNNTTSTLAGTNFKDLFSVDPIRCGKIKSIVLLRKDKKDTYLTGVYNFETKGDKVVHTTVTAPKNYYSNLTQVEMKYDYDKTGNITRIFKSNLSLEVPCRVEASYSYDSLGRVSKCQFNTIDFEKGITLSSRKQTFRKYNSASWPTIMSEQDNSDGDISLDRFSYDFNNETQISRVGRIYYFYDTAGHLVETSKTYRASRNGDGMKVEYSNFFGI